MNVGYFASAVALAVAAAAPAAADTIFENFPTTFNNSGALASDAFGRDVFVNFTPTSDVTVRSIRWLGDYAAAADDFRVSFYENSAPFSSPDTAALLLETSTADTIDPKPFVFDPLFPPVTLEAIYGEDLGAGIALVAGRNYQISVSAIATNIYAWKTASFGCCSVSRLIATGEDTLIGIVPGFGLYGTPLTDGPVPEPMTWALMIAGFGLVGARLRRARGAQPA